MHEQAKKGLRLKGKMKITHRSPKSRVARWEHGACGMKAALRDRQRPNWGELKVQLRIQFFVLKKKAKKRKRRM